MPQNNNMGAYEISYNQDSYRQIVGCYRTSNIKSEGSKSKKYDYTLENESIIELTLVSDMRYPILTGTIVYEDKFLEKVPLLTSDGHTGINIAIYRMKGKYDKDSLSFAHSFVISDVRLQDKVTNTFTIEFKSLQWFVFNNYVEYSTGDEPISYTQIAKNLFNVDTVSQYIHIAGSDKNDKGQITDSENRGTYITPVNTCLLDSCEEVLKYAAEKTHGFYFLQYNFMSDTYFIRSIKSQLKNFGEAQESFNYFYVGGREQDFDARSFRIKKNSFKSAKLINFEDYIDYMKDYRLFSYFIKSNRIIENLGQDIFNNRAGGTIKQYKKYFPNVSRSDFYSIFDGLPNIINNRLESTSEELGETYLDGQEYLKMFTLSNNIEFNVDGFLQRKAGDPMLLNLSEDDQYRKNYFGIWCMHKVAHVFRSKDKIYENKIFACRTEQHKSINEVDELNPKNKFGGE